MLPSVKELYRQYGLNRIADIEAYTLYQNGRQIDTFVVNDDQSAIEWVESNYPINELGETVLMLYSTRNGGGRHVARFTI